MTRLLHRWLLPLALGLGLAAVFFAPFLAHAGNMTPTPTNTTGAAQAATVGVASAQLLGAGSGQVYEGFQNQSSSATVCLNFGATATISGTTCAAGEITLAPLGGWTFEGTFVPADQINAIASAASTPVTVIAK